MAELKRKKATKKDENTIAARDKVLVTYKSPYYDIENIPGVVIAVQRRNGWPIKVKFIDDKGEPINVGHNDDGGAPGSGNIMYCKEDNCQLIEKYVPKRLEGKTKTEWNVGDQFTPREGFGMDLDDTDEITGVVEPMLKCIGQPLRVAAIINRLGVEWLFDATENYCWLPEWVDPIE